MTPDTCPVAALDVSVQAQIINLFKVLQEGLNLTYLFITHNLSVAQFISDRIAVMYLGKVVELSSSEAVFQGQALHPYTRALLSSAPNLDPDLRQERIILTGGVPDPTDPPSGCSFHPRCPMVMPICSESEPPFIDNGDGHMVACHLFSEQTGNMPTDA